MQKQSQHRHYHHHREHDHSHRHLSEHWTINAWSKAGVSTMIAVKERLGKRAILFDCGGLTGVSPSLAMHADVVLLSHGHVDHSGGLFAHARARFADGKKCKYYVPRDALEAIVAARKAFELMDGDEKELNMDIIPVSVGDVINLGKALEVECVATEHRVPSLGFLVYRNVRLMKSEYADLPGEEKAELAKTGVELTRAIRRLEIAYSGDTTARALDRRFFQAELSIIECTFVDNSQANLAKETQHVLLSELEKIIRASDPNPECQLLLMHFSARYSATFIKSAVRSRRLLPKRTALALAAFDFRDTDSREDRDVGVFFA